MKKILLYTLAFAVALNFQACKNEEDDIFDDSAANRMTKACAEYQKRFAASPGGWSMQYYPTNDIEAPLGSGYLLLADIKSDGTVRFAMNNEMTGYVYDEDTSLWEMVRDTGPVISFSTYNNVLHWFSDPAIYDTGNGYYGDYEFVVIDLPEDGNTAMLKGKKRGVYVKMTKLPEGTDFEAYLEDVNKQQSTFFSATAPNKLLLTLGESPMYVELMPTMIPNIYPVGKDNIANESYHPCMLVKDGEDYVLRFRDVVKIDTVENTTQELVWNESAGMFIDVEDPTCTLTGEPVAPFFNNTLTITQKAWQWDAKSEMSASVAQILSNIDDQFKAVNKNYSLSYIQLKVKNEFTQMIIGYKTSKTATSKVAYNFQAQPTEGGITMSYVGPEATAGANILAKVPAIQNMIDVLAGGLNVATVNPLNLTNVKLTSTANAEDWFVTTYK